MVELLAFFLSAYDWLSLYSKSGYGFNYSLDLSVKTMLKLPMVAIGNDLNIFITGGRVYSCSLNKVFTCELSMEIWPRTELVSLYIWK